MIERSFDFYLNLVVIAIALLVLSNIIPYYGFMYKRWKGLLLGCLVQPIVGVLICVATAFFISFHLDRGVRKNEEAAMLTIRETQTSNDTIRTHLWYLKPNDECFYEYTEALTYDVDEPEADLENLTFYDIIPVDSNSVCIDDRILVIFDLQNRQVTATDYDEPMEVVNVNWDRVNAYLKK